MLATELLVGAAEEASDVVTPALDSTTELTCAEVVGVADVVGATEEGSAMAVSNSGRWVRSRAIDVQ